MDPNDTSMNALSNITPTTPATDARRAELTRQARVWVAQTFYGTMFKQMQNSGFRSDLFGGGRGGEVFQSLLDQQLSERMGRGTAEPLVNSIVRQLEKTGENGSAEQRDRIRTLSQTGRTHVAPASGT